MYFDFFNSIESDKAGECFVCACFGIYCHHFDRVLVGWICAVLSVFFFSVIKHYRAELGFKHSICKFFGFFLMGCFWYVFKCETI